MNTGLQGSDVWTQHADTFIDERYHDRTLGSLLHDAGYDCANAGSWAGDRYDQLKNHSLELLSKKDDIRLPSVCNEFFERERAEPFFLKANIVNPHTICQWSDGYNAPWGLVEEVPESEHPPLPANFAIPPDEPKTIHDYGEYCRVNLPMWEATPSEWREYRHAYYRLVEKADRILGEILDGLAESGHRDDTVVVFVSDHGDALGAHQLSHKKFLYEEIMRVPLIISDPTSPSERLVDALVSAGYDLHPTICRFAGIDPPSPSLGQDVTPFVRGESPENWRDHLVSETTRDDLNGRMVRTDRYKYVVYDAGRPNEQLFDLETDPGEMVNLASRSRYQDVLEHHRDLLLSWCERTGDAFGARHTHPGVPMIPGRDFEELWPRFLDQPPAENPDELEPEPQYERNPDE